jgi:hypothetical protein
MQRLMLAILIFLLASATFTPTASAQSTTYRVDGRVKRAGEGVSALTVYLYHPTLGRSHPRFTDFNGDFIFERVAFSNTDYYLEVYWGSTLMHREAITVNQNVSRQYITLR